MTYDHMYKHDKDLLLKKKKKSIAMLTCTGFHSVPNPDPSCSGFSSCTVSNLTEVLKYLFPEMHLIHSIA